MEDKEVEAAATAALEELGITNASFHDVMRYQDSDRRSVRFLEDSGKYFRVLIDPAEILTRERSLEPEFIQAEIETKLRTRAPDDYLP